MNYKILTIDQGTTSSRSITYDINGGTIESSQYEYPLIYPEDGWVEIDPVSYTHLTLPTICSV